MLAPLFLELSATAYVLPVAPLPARAAAARTVAPTALALPDVVDHLPTFNLLAEILDSDGERMYGAV